MRGLISANDFNGRHKTKSKSSRVAGKRNIVDEKSRNSLRAPFIICPRPLATCNCLKRTSSQGEYSQFSYKLFALFFVLYNWRHWLYWIIPIKKRKWGTNFQLSRRRDPPVWAVGARRERGREDRRQEEHPSLVATTPGSGTTSCLKRPGTSTEWTQEVLSSLSDSFKFHNACLVWWEINVIDW